MSKQYGLSFPKQNTGHQIGQVSLAKPSVFDNNSDNEDQPTKPTGIRGSKKQDIISQEKAIADDPTVYQYDEVYDQIENKRNESKLARTDLEKKPKYISKLLAAAEKRKRENERRIERQVQKEREDEGDMFKDKESFITPSYKKKLEEMRQLEEEEKREEYLESIGDVKKQGNLDGFYRHLYDQKINYQDKEETEKDDTEIKKEAIEDVEEQISPENNETVAVNEGKSDKLTRKRKYRTKRNLEDDSPSEEEPEVKKEHLPSNIDADSDFSVDSSDSDEEDNKKAADNKKSADNKKQVEEPIKTEIKYCNIVEIPSKPEELIKKEIEIKTTVKKEKIDIWKKRTVGEKFEEALKRYFERKAIRDMGQ